MTDRGGTAPQVQITDVAAGDLLAIDDHLFGLGSHRIDVRNLPPMVYLDLVPAGTASCQTANGELRIDVVGDGTRDPLASLGDRTRLTFDEVLLF